MKLSYAATAGSSFTALWTEEALLLQFGATVTYLVLAWLAAQLIPVEGSEGRSLSTVLFPRFIRKFLFADDEIEVEGDVRRYEQRMSLEQRSVRVDRTG
jgi:hypothetical protein